MDRIPLMSDRRMKQPLSALQKQQQQHPLHSSVNNGCRNLAGASPLQSSITGLSVARLPKNSPFLLIMNNNSSSNNNKHNNCKQCGPRSCRLLFRIATIAIIKSRPWSRGLSVSLSALVCRLCWVRSMVFFVSKSICCNFPFLFFSYLSFGS